MVIINKKKSTINNKNISNINKLILLFFILFVFIPKGYSQNADPGIGILMSPASLSQGSAGILSASVGNYSNNTIVSNSLRVTISVGANAEILGIAAGSDPRWSQLTLTTGSANTIRLTNTGGGFSSFDVGDILLTVRGNVVSDPDTILGNIVYIAATNPLLCIVPNCASPPLNASQGNASNPNDNSQTSLAVAARAIVAVVDTPTSVNGITGGTTCSLTLNDTLDGSPVVIGAAPGNVVLSGTTVPAGLTLNPDGTVTIAPNTPAGNYTLTYKICEVSNPLNCASVNSTIVVFTGIQTDLCINDDLDFDLFSLLDGTFQRDATLWSVSSGNATINGSLFNPFGLETGDYIFTYTDATSECLSGTEFTISLNDDCGVCNNLDNVIISKAVTPNGDQYNEYFTIEGLENCGFTVEVEIFNRWGAKIYESKDYQNNWNGFAHSNSIGGSNNVPAGTYYYIVNVVGSAFKPLTGYIYVGI
jgi:gliding motility-associated-like protein